MNKPDVKRIAALADLHCPRTGEDILKSLFGHVVSEADVVLLCGDLTDYGKPEEAKILVQALSVLGRIPVLAVLGNHDHESGAVKEVERRVAEETILDVDASGYWLGKTVTRVSEAGRFWEEEAEDQDFLQRYPVGCKAPFPRAAVDSGGTGAPA